MNAEREQGFSLIELLIGLALLGLLIAGLAPLLVQSGKANRAQQLRLEAQANARQCVAIVVQRIRSTGWNPRNIAFTPVTFDSNPSDGIETLTVRADLNEDGDVNDQDESVEIRHIADRIEWKRTAASTTYEILAVNVSNDADGDGTEEAMFTPDSTTAPTRIAVRVTARTATADPMTGVPARETVRQTALLRNGG